MASAPSTEGARLQHAHMLHGHQHQHQHHSHPAAAAIIIAGGSSTVSQVKRSKTVILPNSLPNSKLFMRRCDCSKIYLIPHKGRLVLSGNVCGLFSALFTIHVADIHLSDAQGINYCYSFPGPGAPQSSRLPPYQVPHFHFARRSLFPLTLL